MSRFRSISARVLVPLGVLALVATACQPSGPGERATGDQPVRGGRIVEGTTSDIKTLQPVNSTDAASSNVHGRVYVGLLRSNPDTADIEPGLAERVEQSADGLTVTFTLRDGLAWSDGVPFTGEDYKYTAEATMRSKRTARKSNIQDIVGAREYADGKADTISGIQVSPDGKTITVKLSKVNCAALRNLGGAGPGGIIPKHHFIKHFDPKTPDTSKTIDDNPLNLAPPASMGPFIFKEHRPGVQTTLVRNPSYYRGATLIDELIVKVYADNSAVKAALLTGEISYGSVSPQDVDEVKQATGNFLDFYRLKGVARYQYIGWNFKSTKAPWLASKPVRQALWHGINVDQIIEKILLGYAHRVYAHIPQASAFYEDPGFNKYPYDPQRAKQLLEQAGAKLGPDGVYRWSDGKPMEMKIEGQQGSIVSETIIQVAQEQYKQIGIKVIPLLESFPALVQRTDDASLDVDGFVLGWSLGVDPDSALMTIWHSQGPKIFNSIYYGNPEVDKAAEAGRFGPDCSLATRKKQYSIAMKALNDDAPYTFLYTGDTLLFASKSIGNYTPKAYSTGSEWNIEKWWIRR